MLRNVCEIGVRSSAESFQYSIGDADGIISVRFPREGLSFQYSIGDALTTRNRIIIRMAVAPFNTPLEMRNDGLPSAIQRVFHLSILHWRCVVIRYEDGTVDEIHMTFNTPLEMQSVERRGEKSRRQKEAFNTPLEMRS